MTKNVFVKTKFCSGILSMVSTHQSQHHSVSAEPEFDERCKTTYSQWKKGELPFEDASVQMKALIEEAIANQHLANQARAELLLGNMHGYRSNLNSSIKHFEIARDLYAAVGNEGRVTSCNLNLGEIYRQKGDFIKARKLFAAAYENAVKLDQIKTQAIARGNEGQMLISIGEPTIARDVLQEAVTLSENWPEDDLNTRAGMLCEVYHALAVINLNDTRLGEAWEQAQHALEMANQLSEPLSIGQANRTMGEVLTVLEDTEHEATPDSYFKASIEAFNGINAEGEMARTMHAYAHSLLKRGRRVRAARQLQKATLIFAKLGMIDDSSKAAEAQAQIF